MRRDHDDALACRACRVNVFPAAGALDQFQHLVIRAQPDRQQFDDGLAGLADGLAQQALAIAFGRAQPAFEHVVAHASGMAARRPVNQPAQRDAQAMQHGQRQARQ